MLSFPSGTSSFLR